MYAHPVMAQVVHGKIPDTTPAQALNHGLIAHHAMVAKSASCVMGVANINLL